MNELDSLVESATQLFAQSATPADLENAKAQFLGKSGRVTELMKGMAQLSVDEKKSRGAAINVAKQAIEAALTARNEAGPMVFSLWMGQWMWEPLGGKGFKLKDAAKRLQG